MEQPIDNSNDSPSQEESEVKSLYGEGVDIALPDILLPPQIEEDKTKKLIEDECLVSFKNAFIGSGQGGSRIAETFHSLGYRRVAAINTAQQDLNTIELIENKFVGSVPVADAVFISPTGGVNTQAGKEPDNPLGSS